MWTRATPNEVFFTLTPSGDPNPGGVELASYGEAMAQLGRVFAGTNFHRHRAGIDPGTPRTTVS